MAAVTSGSILARAQFAVVNTIASGINSPANVDYPQGGAPTVLANGTGANQINLGWADQRTLTASNVTLALNALAAAATNTGAAAFTAFKTLTIFNDATSTGNLVVGNAATLAAPIAGTGATAFTVTIKPGSSYQFTDLSAAGQSLAANFNLKLDAGASTCLVTTVIQGLS